MGMDWLCGKPLRAADRDGGCGFRKRGPKGRGSRLGMLLAHKALRVAGFKKRDVDQAVFHRFLR
jgi:hypothetical protein